MGGVQSLDCYVRVSLHVPWPSSHAISNGCAQPGVSITIFVTFCNNSWNAYYKIKLCCSFILNVFMFTGICFALYLIDMKYFRENCFSHLVCINFEISNKHSCICVFTFDFYIHMYIYYEVLLFSFAHFRKKCIQKK